MVPLGSADMRSTCATAARTADAAKEAEPVTHPHAGMARRTRGLLGRGRAKRLVLPIDDVEVILVGMSSAWARAVSLGALPSLAARAFLPLARPVAFSSCTAFAVLFRGALVEIRMRDRRGRGAELRSYSVEPPRSCLLSSGGAVLLAPPPSSEDATKV